MKFGLETMRGRELILCMVGSDVVQHIASAFGLGEVGHLTALMTNRPEFGSRRKHSLIH